MGELDHLHPLYIDSGDVKGDTTSDFTIFQCKNCQDRGARFPAFSQRICAHPERPQVAGRTGHPSLVPPWSSPGLVMGVGRTWACLPLPGKGALGRGTCPSPPGTPPRSSPGPGRGVGRTWACLPLPGRGALGRGTCPSPPGTPPRSSPGPGMGVGRTWACLPACLPASTGERGPRPGDVPLTAGRPSPVFPWSSL